MEVAEKVINVTKPFLPPLEEYQQYVNGIWERAWLTNHGPLVDRLEKKINEYLGVNGIFLSNGTVALQIAIKALELSGEVITTPFSFVATTSSIAWESCKPVFVDIDPDTLNMDASLIETAITPKTTGIVATHVYGNPCNIDKIEKIAKQYGLKVIYDAAHCFGTKYNGRSVYEFGDVSTASYHATKLFHTVEGGGVFSRSPELLRKMNILKNFGHTSAETFDGFGINGKNSELHAAMGLANLNYIEEILTRRKQLCAYYDKKLEGLRILKPKVTQGADYNYAYYPVIFTDESVTLKVISALQSNGVNPRRYFYPSLSQLNYVDKFDLPIADDVSRRVLCLPLYHDLSFEDIDLISVTLHKSLTS